MTMLESVECHPIVNREEWLTWREQDITASHMGALFDVSPYETSLKLYAAHRGVEFERKPEDKVMRRGRWLERVVGDAVAELRPEWTVEPVGAYYRQPTLRLGGTPDFWILGDVRGRGVLQAKSVAPSVLAKAWDQGRVPPEWIVWQLRTEMLLTNAAFGAIGALVVDPFNMDCHIFEVARDAEAEQLLLSAVKQFWNNVTTGTEPQPDFSRDAEVIKALTRKVTPGLARDLSGNNELPDLLEQRAMLMGSISDMKDRCEAIEAEVKYLMGDADHVSGLNGWRITYKVEDRKEYVVKARSGRVLRIRDKREES
jgi:predicted phage-related endonuclease